MNHPIDIPDMSQVSKLLMLETKTEPTAEGSRFSHHCLHFPFKNVPLPHTVVNLSKKGETPARSANDK